MGLRYLQNGLLPHLLVQLLSVEAGAKSVDLSTPEFGLAGWPDLGLGQACLEQALLHGGGADELVEVLGGADGGVAQLLQDVGQCPVVGFEEAPSDAGQVRRAGRAPADPAAEDGEEPRRSSRCAGARTGVRFRTGPAGCE